MRRLENGPFSGRGKLASAAGVAAKPNPLTCGGVHDLRAQRQADAHQWCIRVRPRGVGGLGCSGNRASA